MNTNYVLIDFENVQPESLELLTAEHFRVVVFVGARQNCVPLETVRSLQPFGSRVEYVKISRPGPNSLDFHIAYYLGRLAVVEPTAHFHVISNDTGFDPLIEHLRSQRIPVRRVGRIKEIFPVEASVITVTSSTISRIPEPILEPDRSLPQTAIKPTSSTAIALAAQSAIQAAAKPAVQPSVNPVAKPALIAPAKPSVNVAAKSAGAKSSQEQLAVIVARLKKSPSNRPRTIAALCHSIKSWLGQQASEADVARMVQSLKSQKYLRVTDAKKVEYEFAQQPVATPASLIRKVKTTRPPA